MLNQDYAPLSVARVPRALALVDRGKAEILEHGTLPIQTPTCAIPRPAVIRLVAYVRRPRPVPRFGRRAVFHRDNYTCQYCGARPRPANLTLDHVVPRHQGGASTWDNVVACCRACNQRKGGRTPAQARMKLRTVPRAPRTRWHLIDTTDLPLWRPFLGHSG